MLKITWIITEYFIIKKKKSKPNPESLTAMQKEKKGKEGGGPINSDIRNNINNLNIVLRILGTQYLEFSKTAQLCYLKDFHTQGTEGSQI